MTSNASLKDRITEDMKGAMRAKDAARLGAIRLLQAAIKQKEVDERVVADDAAVLVIIDKLIKQRRDSIEQFGRAGRTDLVDKEQAELDLLLAYLPQQLSEAEVAAAIDAAIARSGAAGAQESAGDGVAKTPARRARPTWARSPASSSRSSPSRTGKLVGCPSARPFRRPTGGRASGKYCAGIALRTLSTRSHDSSRLYPGPVGAR
jgi:uncharacterized protein YqeY